MSDRGTSYRPSPKGADAQDEEWVRPVLDAPALVVDILRARLERSPDREACRYRNAAGQWISVSWREHVRDITRVAGVLRSAGISCGDRLAVRAHTSREWHVVEMAGLLIGAAIVGVDTHAVPGQVEHVLGHSGATALVHDREACVGRLSPRALAGLKVVREIRELCAMRPSRPEESCSLESASCAPDDPAAIVYTSGTTGLPKGIEYTHRQLLVACASIAEAFPNPGPQGGTLCWLPMSNLLQRILNLVAIRLGMTLSFVEDPRQVVALAKEANPTLLVGVPRFFEKLCEGIQRKLASSSGWKARWFGIALAVGDQHARCLRAGRRPSWRLRLRHAVLDRLVLKRIRGVLGSRIRFLMTGSAPTPLWLLEFFQACGLLILEGYGVSENSVLLALNRADAYRFGSVGLPLPASSVRISPEGEVLVRGPGLFRGYLGEADTQGLFTEDGYYRTGDCGHFDADGFLHLTGRRCDLLKTSTGRRIAPAQVESVYRRSRHVDQVVVAGQGRKHLTALVVPRFDVLEADHRFVGRSRGELAACPLLRSLIRQDFERLERDLPAPERVVDFAVLARPFSLESGELTGSLKLRRERVLANYAAAIDRLYQTPKPGPAAEKERPQGEEKGLRSQR